MYIEVEEDTEYYSETHTCEFHQRNPGVPYAGCTCGGTVGMKRTDEDDRTPETQGQEIHSIQRT